MEQLGVDRAAQQDARCESVRFEELAELGGRHDRRVGAVVEAAQVRVNDRRQEAEAVEARVIVEARMESGACRNAEVAAPRQAR